MVMQQFKLEAIGTHEVLNQPPPLAGYNVFTQDAALVEGVRREGAGWAEERLQELGRLAGSEQAIQWGFDANTSTPTLKTHDRYGHRIDEVVFHPSWHQLMETAVTWGLHASSWREPRPGAHIARVAASYVWSQVEAGHGCPIYMTHAAIPALRAQLEIGAEWEPRLLSLTYDPGLRPAAEKRGMLAGMGMTEKQGGSDVRANTTRAEPVGAGGPGGNICSPGISGSARRRCAMCFWCWPRLQRGFLVSWCLVCCLMARATTSLSSG